jgi:hypothetical protein
MVLSEHNYRQKILSYTRKDWQPLLNLIPEIEEALSFGEKGGGKRDEDGVMQLPFVIPAYVVTQFVDIVYEMPLMVSFDWPSWDEGREMLHDPGFDFDSIDIPTKCKLITAIIRNDRFADGALVRAFESGLILEILKSIQRQLILEG